MENYSYAASYPESGDSSPRSREIDFENPPPWEDQNQPPPPNYKVKFMCSYGGKINPRPHDNQLSYIGGETKILAVDRNIKFSSLIAKLSALCDSESVLFKYQLPGEDLDALISVTNDDDLEHMLHEYDRLYRASPKPARLRLFLFPVNPSLSASSSGVVPQRSFGSEEARSEKERFVEALNSGPIQTTPAPAPAPALQPQNNVDFLFGLEKGVAPPQVPPLQPVKLRVPIADTSAVVHEPEVPVPGIDDRNFASDPIQKHIQDLQRLRLEEQQGLYRRKSDDNLAGGYAGAEYYLQKVPEKVSPVTVPGTGPIPAGYWPEKQVPGGVYQTTSHGAEQPVYMIPAPPGAAYHAPMMRPMTGPVGQGYYTVQRMPPEVYRDQQVYNVVQSAPPPVQSIAAAPPTLPPQAPPRMSAAAYSEGIGMIRPTTSGGIGMVEAQYSQMAYDNAAGRQVYYNAPGGGVMAGPPPHQQQQQYQTVPASSAAAVGAADMMRPVGALNQDGGKVVVPKATQASV